MSNSLQEMLSDIDGRVGKNSVFSKDVSLERSVYGAED